MKELSIEQKAKRFDEVLAMAKECITYVHDDAVNKYMLNMFPELKESEDESIRKFLYHTFTVQYLAQDKLGKWHGEPVSNILAWLEKQSHDGKKWIYEDEYYKEKEQLYQDGVDDVLENPHKYGLEKQNEPKPQGKTALEAIHEEKVDNQNCVKSADKVEPKFHGGEWIIRSAEGFKHNTYLIKEVKDYYVCEELKGRRVTFTFNDVHKNFKLWDISDAKEGDVLVCKGDIKGSNGIKYERICLIKNLDNAFFTLTKTSNNVEEYDIDVNIDYPDNTVPATKEQKEILFMAMTDAGYTFDFEKKEFKKLEPKEVDLEEDVDRILEGYDWNFEKIDFCEFAKHFFELGLNAKKGE